MDVKKSVYLYCIMCVILFCYYRVAESLTKLSSMSKLEIGDELIGQLAQCITVKTQMDCLRR